MCVSKYFILCGYLVGRSGFRFTEHLIMCAGAQNSGSLEGGRTELRTWQGSCGPYWSVYQIEGSEMGACLVQRDPGIVRSGPTQQAALYTHTDTRVHIHTRTRTHTHTHTRTHTTHTHTHTRARAHTHTHRHAHTCHIYTCIHSGTRERRYG